MKKRFAVRNLRMCEKDCLCLYVCPTGASDTENSIIDVEKCIGCGACADACPTKAISMAPVDYPPQQHKTDGVAAAMRALLKSKAEQEAIAASLEGTLAKALERSCASPMQSPRWKAMSGFSSSTASYMFPMQ